MHKAVGLILGIAFLINSCCEPKPKDSYPLVINSSYSDTAIHDVTPVIPPQGTVDSIYYPIYQFDIKNTGTEADTFTVVFFREKGHYDIFNPQLLFDEHFVKPGETATFKTYGPIPRNAPDSSRFRYVSFFTSTPDSIPIAIMHPEVVIYYGSSLDGPESCGSPALTLNVNVDSLGL